MSDTENHAPVLEVEKLVSKRTASPGDSLVYTLSYRNTGTDQADLWYSFLRRKPA